MAALNDLLTEILEADRAMLEHFGIEFVRAASGRAELAAVARAELLNSHHVAHGGLAFAMADTAAAYAMASLDLHAVTIGSTIAFTAPIRAGQTVRAVAEILSRGRTFCVIEAEVSSERGTCATATVRFAVRRGSP